MRKTGNITKYELSKLVSKYLEYRDGALYWKDTCAPKIVPGKKIDGRCHLVIVKKYRLYKTQVIFYLTRGYWADFVTFVDGNKNNYSPSNLQEIRYRKDSTSGYTGVSYIHLLNKWRAASKRKGKFLIQKAFNTPQEAYHAYCQALKKYNQQRMTK
jgi:hypothetical protein